jgi:hypothetical protein
MKCIGCGKDDELRLGFCWDCASEGEARAARRSVLQHLAKALSHIGQTNFRYDIKWAWERLTRTGDYAPGGYFHSFGIKI